ncbi:penicillin-binding transpeptidase domain-containing protein [Nonomuraea sp. NPDC050310]|uniref:penicillin-binding transpeptidase domain-containing protein n=1 Tax=unclassified Nonomuraea TaxID=2593643 RepID=UPI00340BF8E5
MRRRRLIALGIGILCVVAAAAFAVGMGSGGVRGSAEQTARAYFRAWTGRDVDAMRSLVDRPPADFTRRHLGLSEALQLEGVDLRPRPVRQAGADAAEVPFTGTMRLKRFGPWEFESTLRLAVRERRWKVVWTPETLHPLLKGGATIEVEPVEGPAVTLVTAEGAQLPRRGYNDAYLDALRTEFEGTSVGWALVAAGERVKEIPPKTTEVRLTLSRPVQAAAARALDEVEDAAIVALRASTGEVLAVADRLVRASAFTDYFPPGSTFKVVSAAALLETGLQPDTPVDCPASYQIPFHSPVGNAAGFEVGLTTFEGAFAWSCNTSFVQQAYERELGPRLAGVAADWGFTDRPLATGMGGRCGRLTEPGDPEELKLAVIGQGTVEATPLCMAAVAAAVRSGTWQPPRLLGDAEATRIDGARQPAVRLDPVVIEQLRRMMGTVVSGGTASEGGLPEDVYGKTGTAETPGGGDHAWFIGYQDDLAFCVFVRHGGSGAKVAVPVAARFLRGL